MSVPKPEHLFVHGGVPVDLMPLLEQVQAQAAAHPGGALPAGGGCGAPAGAGVPAGSGAHGPLDFSACVNPLGMPPRARRAAALALEMSERYPDPACSQLRAGLLPFLEEHLGAQELDVRNILCGAGAADLIDRLCRVSGWRHALLCAPTFSEYERCLRLAGTAVHHLTLPAGKDFDVQQAGLLQVLEAGVPGTAGQPYDCLFLCEPNNPTGRVTARAHHMEILDKCHKTGCTLVVDECFNAFLDKPAEHSLVREIPRYKNLLIVRAFTKIFGMAGLRLGYVISQDQGLLRLMSQAGSPWPVSLPAQAAGLAVLGDSRYLEESRAIVRAQRAWMAQQLSGLGFHVVPGMANYLLVKTPGSASAAAAGSVSSAASFATPAAPACPGDPHAAQAGSANIPDLLSRRGIALRDCSRMYGLGPGWWRVAVLDHGRNAQCIQELGVCMNAGAEGEGGPCQI